MISPDQAPFDGVGLADDQSSSHERGRLADARRDAPAGRAPHRSRRRHATSSRRASATTYSEPQTTTRSSGPASSSATRDRLAGRGGHRGLHAQARGRLGHHLGRQGPGRVGGAGDHRPHAGGAQGLEHGHRVATGEHARPRPRSRRRRRTPRRASGPGRACRPRCGPRRPRPAGGGPPPRAGPGRAPRRTPPRPRPRGGVRRRRPRPRPGRTRRCRPGGHRAGGPAARRSAAPGVRRSMSRPPTASRLAVQANSGRPAPTTRRRRPPRPPARSSATRVGVGLAHHHPAAPALMMPALSRAMSSSVGPSTSVWSKLTLVITATSPSTTLVQSHGHRGPPRPRRRPPPRRRTRRGRPPSAARTGWAVARAAARARASASSTSTKASSSMGSPLRARRSLTRARLGLV